MNSPHPASDDGAATPPPWYLRTVSLVATVVVLVAVAALVLPSVRHQVDLSLRHAPERYVALYFAAPATPGVQEECQRSGSTVRVGFVIESHLSSTQDLPYLLQVTTDGRAPVVREVTGSTRVRPGHPASLAETVTRISPSHRAYTVEVTLPGRDEELRARCTPAVTTGS